MFTAGLDLVDSQKDAARHTVQNDADLAKVWWVLSIFIRIFQNVIIRTLIIHIIVPIYDRNSAHARVEHSL
jgi:hypothetical protein